MDLTNLFDSLMGKLGESLPSILGALVILIIGWFSQKQLVRGLTFGAVK